MIDGLERLCDEHNETLPELKSFVLPGGTEAAARLNVARAVGRRAELAALTAAEAHDVNPLVLVYLNRLSDLLFILSRAANALAGRDEPLWRPGGTRDALARRGDPRRAGERGDDLRELRVRRPLRQRDRRARGDRAVALLGIVRERDEPDRRRREDDAEVVDQAQRILVGVDDDHLDVALRVAGRA